MSSWLEDYLAALDNRDRREKANAATIEAYSKLADRTAALEAAIREAPTTPSAPEPAATPSRLPTRILGSPRSPPPPPESASVVSLRADLVAANRNKAVMETQLSALTTQLTTLQATSMGQTSQTASLQKQIALLEHEKASLTRKLRDRESELKEKARLVENVQDEMLGLEMQINVAEERSTKLQQENKELVDRWMQRMGKEAERMNEGSGWN
ncbi:hypothetical protein FH972_024422 [Carpinus fangiana]|uniref:Autophagy-related protein 16 domain-containing protein n=1 Tax=Carpinus fangiana TaxID=176857 RepID=A0A5N6L0I0_9ROSI|nr:hypothetical protein FH972_024422 [Carpinus fangiana]